MHPVFPLPFKAGDDHSPDYLVGVPADDLLVSYPVLEADRFGALNDRCILFAEGFGIPGFCGDDDVIVPGALQDVVGNAEPEGSGSPDTGQMKPVRTDGISGFFPGDRMDIADG